MSLVEMIQQKSFLGSEFVTWLWYKSEGRDRTIDLGDGRKCEVLFEKDLVLTGEWGETLAGTFRGDAPTLSPEAAAALAAGKKVKRARMTFSVGEATYTLTLNAESFDWSGLKIETPPSISFDEAVPLRLAALDQFHDVFERLFSIFLDLRLDPDRWAKELKAVRKWVTEKNEGEE
ncbi:hypothetical protein JW916_10895 [Candidatus Sumerlaeota bacterium]|nr:hypothetical protein [Candidatus Sumerlaeota bacterium]